MISSVVHVLNVGSGTMVLLLLDDGTVALYGCYLTTESKEVTIGFLRQNLPMEGLDIFIHPGGDSTHVAGLLDLQHEFPVHEVWEPESCHGGEPGLDSREYVTFKRSVHNVWRMTPGIRDFGASRLRLLAQARSPQAHPGCGRFPILRVEHLDQGSGKVLHTMLFAGSARWETWRDEILPANLSHQLTANVLLASECGSWGFFGNTSRQKEAFEEHMQTIAPVVTVVSVGKDRPRLPTRRAAHLYRKYSTNRDKTHRVILTRETGHVTVRLSGSGERILSFAGGSAVACA